MALFEIINPPIKPGASAGLPPIALAIYIAKKAGIKPIIIFATLSSPEPNCELLQCCAPVAGST